MDKLYFIFETSQSLSDTGIGSITEQEVSESNDVYRVRVDWVAKKSVPDDCRYEIISQSQFPPILIIIVGIILTTMVLVN